MHSPGVASAKLHASRRAKISCRNLWKIYGPDAANLATRLRDVPTGDALISGLRDAGNVVAAADVSFDVHVGEIFVIMGLSGSGKSTVVRCLSRLVEPDQGQVLLDGEDLLQASRKQLVDIRRHKMGMVFQSFGLFPHLTVAENVAFPLRLQGVSSRDRAARVHEVIDLVGLVGRENAYPSELSGGQQQRVGIARSLAVEPQLWFLDEPFSALDPLIRKQMQNEFLRLQTMLRKTIVFITHDFLEALRLADRIAIMKDGRIIQIGSPSEIVLRPLSDYVRKFTADVPLSHVVSAGDLLEPYDGALPTIELEDLATPLLDILGHFATNPQGIGLKNTSGEILGQLRPARVFEILAQNDDKDKWELN